MDVEYIVRFMIGFVLGWLTAKYLIRPALVWLAKKWTNRNPKFIDITARMVALGAPELPNNLKYVYDTRDDTVDINFNGTVYWTKVGTPADTKAVPASFLKAARKTHSSFLPVWEEREKKKNKLAFAQAGGSENMKVLGERRAWVDDAS